MNTHLVCENFVNIFAYFSSLDQGGLFKFRKLFVLFPFCDTYLSFENFWKALGICYNNMQKNVQIS